MDQIIIENLRIYANHGVYREENEKGQNFYINAILETNTRKAGTLDDLDLSTNYGEVCMFLNSFLKEHTYKLIETAAEKAAEAVLFRFPLVRRLTLEVRKPEAPVPLPFESVSVKIVRGWHKAYLSCGSNMGDRKMHLDGAVEAVRNDRKCRILRVSDWLATEPYGGVAKGEFLNGAIEMETLYTPEELLEKLHEIERIHGRERKVRWDSRTLDLDILLYEDCVMYTENLTIPHVDMQNRYFVLEPLRQIASYERHPVLGKSIGQMYEALMERERPAEPGQAEKEAEPGQAERPAESGQEEKPAEAGQTERPAESGQAEKPAEAGQTERPVESGQKEQPAEWKEQVDLEIQARKLTLEEARRIYETYAKTDFPPEEIKPFSVIAGVWEQGGYHAYGFYEKNAEKATENMDKESAAKPSDKVSEPVLCAYAFLVADKEKHVLLLDYFAVIKQKRGTGCGSAALSLLRKTCGDWNGLVIEVEDDELLSIDEGTRTMRKRRISFYTAAGCRMTGTRSRVWGVDYRLMIMPLSDELAENDMGEKVTSLYKCLYDEKTLRQHFAITAGG